MDWELFIKIITAPAYRAPAPQRVTASDMGYEPDTLADVLKAMLPADGSGLSRRTKAAVNRARPLCRF